MDLGPVIFWFVVLSSVSTLVVALARFRSIGKGWIILYVGILVICVIGWFWEKEALIYTAAAMWGVLVLLPGIIGQLYHQRFLQQNYTSAYRLARIIGWLHPFDGWREQPKIIRAHELAQRGELEAAKEMLGSFHQGKSTINVAAITGLYRLAHQWEELLAWHAQRPTAIERHPQLLPGLLRAHGETGDVRGLVELYASHEQQIRKLMPASNRDLSRLVLFAFCGKRHHTERLLATSLAMLPRWIQEFWLATAELYASETEAGRQRLEALLSEATPQTRSAIDRRLFHLPNELVSLELSAEALIERVAQEQSQDESFGGRRSLFSKHARGTQIIIALNLVTFAAEMYYGGSTKLQVLYRLGALYPKAVWAGEWWRLITAQFLHFGALHLAMNMCALWLFGPFAEFALGTRRFLVTYLIAGIASMALVMVFGSGANHDQLTVGASGCVMGLIGATAALMLRGWRREKALTAKRRLFAMGAIVAMQTVFDSVVPQVSMTGHLSGAALGFLVVTLMRDRLGKKAQASPTLNGPVIGG